MLFDPFEKELNLPAAFIKLRDGQWIDLKIVRKKPEAIAATIIRQKADYVLALKGNQNAIHDDVKRFFADPVLAAECQSHLTTDAGHGQIEERVCRATENIGWLRDLHPQWQNLHSIAAITSTRTSKKTGETSTETRFYLSSLPCAPELILHATRSHWSIENKLHWVLDVTFREDVCRTRKDYAAANLSLVRKIVLNLLRQDTSFKKSLRLKRLKASLNPGQSTELTSDDVIEKICIPSSDMSF